MREKRNPARPEGERSPSRPGSALAPGHGGLHHLHPLSEIVIAQGGTDTAADWSEKRDALLAELKQRAGGGGLPAQTLQALACARAGFGDGTLGPAAEEAHVKLDGYPAPFPDFTAALRQLAAGTVPTIPHSLTPELPGILQKILDALK